MLSELLSEEKQRILPLVADADHELTVASVIFGSSPGEVWVDDRAEPSCGLIMTPECNLFFGRPSDNQTNEELLRKIGYFGMATCASPSWNLIVEKCHMNLGIRKYARLHYVLEKEGLSLRPSEDRPLILRFDDLESLKYAHKDIVLDWINILDRSGRGNLPVAAVVVKDGMIVSCSALDCIHGERAEIGIKTLEGFRRRGYGRQAVASLSMALFDSGVREIGWHCVGTNKGSIAVAESAGFKKNKEYESFSPFPPIENVDDLDAAGWVDYALFFEDKAKLDANHLWQAAKCWAKATEVARSIECIASMVEKNLLWFRDYLGESPEFSRFDENDAWVRLMRSLP